MGELGAVLKQNAGEFLFDFKTEYRRILQAIFATLAASPSLGFLCPLTTTCKFMDRSFGRYVIGELMMRFFTPWNPDLGSCCSRRYFPLGLWANLR